MEHVEVGGRVPPLASGGEAAGGLLLLGLAAGILLGLALSEAGRAGRPAERDGLSAVVSDTLPE